MIQLDLELLRRCEVAGQSSDRPVVPAIPLAKSITVWRPLLRLHSWREEAVVLDGRSLALSLYSISLARGLSPSTACIHNHWIICIHPRVPPVECASTPDAIPDANRRQAAKAFHEVDGL